MGTIFEIGCKTKSCIFLLSTILDPRALFPSDRAGVCEGEEALGTRMPLYHMLFSKLKWFPRC